DPGRVETHRELGEIFRAREDWPRLEESLDAQETLSTEESEESRAEIAYQRGLIHRDRLGDLGKAAFHLARAVRGNPGHAEASRALAEVSEKLGAFSIARPEWRRLAA